MKFFLTISRWIDALNEKIGHAASYFLLIAVLICTGNAIAPNSINTSFNGWQEIQWYLFSAIFLLGSSYTLRRNEHVRIDVITGRFSKRTQVWIDLMGFIFFLLPMTLLIVYLSYPYALESIRNQEMSNNAGGLIVWPAKLLIPVSFILLTLQGVSEIIKRVGFLTGHIEASVFEKAVVTPDDEVTALKTSIEKRKLQ